MSGRFANRPTTHRYYYGSRQQENRWKNHEPTQRKPLGRLIGAFNTVSTQRVNDLKGTPDTQLWQRNYHERVIRNSLALDALRRYITNNPVLWVPE